MPKMNTAIASNVVPFNAPTFNWNNPDTSLLGNSAVAAPAFPLDVLGDEASRWTSATAQAANAAVDYVGASLITVAAGLIGNSRVVSFGEWSEPSVVWCVLVGEPSAKKTPAMAPLKHHVDALEKELGENRSDQEKPAPRLRIGDATARATQEIAYANPRGLILQQDEISGWWGQINKTGKEQFWLEAYGAGSYSIDRANKPSVLIPRLSVSVLGTTQPDPIRDLLAAKTERGFAARYLYIYPEPKRGFVRPARIDQSVARDALGSLVDLEMPNGEPLQCDLSDEAANVAEGWLIAHDERESRAQGRWAQWLGKQGGMLLRYALVFEHLWWAFDGYESDEPTEIGARAVRAAARFIDTYAIPMAARTFDMSMRPIKEQQASCLIRLLVEHNLETFNARDIRRTHVGSVTGLKDADTMTAICETLTAAHLIRSVATRAGSNKGRMRGDFEINPILIADRLKASIPGAQA